MSIALLLVPLALALPECRAVEMGDRPEFRFAGTWELVRRDPAAVAMASIRVGRGKTTIILTTEAPGLTVLVFQHVAGTGIPRRDLPRHVVVLLIAPRKAGK